MKIAIYGVSRSGKNYLIDKLIPLLAGRSYHLEGSQTLNQMSIEKFGCRFKELSETQKDHLRKEFTKLIHKKEEEYGVVFVDGHYSFIAPTGYNVVFTSEDLHAYDVFFYLDTPENRIVENARNSSGEKKNTMITEVDIQNWKEFEISQMAEICSENKKQFKVLGKHTDQSIKQILKYALEMDNRERITKHIRKLAKQCKNNLAILLDADGTLIHFDSTDVISNYLSGVHPQDIKPIFQRFDEYCFDAFYEVAKYYSKDNKAEDFIAASKKAANEINIRYEFIHLIQNIKADFFIITAGFSHLWNEIVAKYKFKNVHVIAGNTLYDEFIVGQEEKAIVAEVLKNNNKTVVSFGDALVDKDMFLNSDFGYLIIDERIKSIATHLQNDERFQYISFGNLEIEGMQKVSFDAAFKQLSEIAIPKLQDTTGSI